MERTTLTINTASVVCYYETDLHEIVTNLKLNSIFDVFIDFTCIEYVKKYCAGQFESYAIPTNLLTLLFSLSHGPRLQDPYAHQHC